DARQHVEDAVEPGGVDAHQVAVVRADGSDAVDVDVIGDVEVAGRRGVFAGTGYRQRYVTLEVVLDDDEILAGQRVGLHDRGAEGARGVLRRAAAVTRVDVHEVVDVVDGEGGSPRSACDPRDREQDASDQRSETTSHDAP